MSMYGLLPQIFFTEQGTEYESYSLTVGTEVIQDVLPDRELRIRRAPNVTNVSVYIDRAEEMARRKEILFTQTEGEKPCES